jgi:5-methylcytosine-specific restriction protein B
VPQRYISPGLLDQALLVLESWSSQVVLQRSRHVWSLLPIKVSGAMPGESLSYAEQNDREFMDRFLAVRDDPDYPYFDPFSRRWLPSGYFHSNMATMRKNRFAREYGACEWEDETIRLAPNYADIFVKKVLTKAGAAARIPAVACAVWFFKRPSAEWPDDSDLTNGVPANAADTVSMFRKKFNFEGDPGWTAIFDPDPSLLPSYAESLRMTP